MTITRKDDQLEKSIEVDAKDLIGWLEGIAVRLDDLGGLNAKNTAKLVEAIGSASDSICNALWVIEKKMP